MPRSLYISLFLGTWTFAKVLWSVMSWSFFQRTCLIIMTILIIFSTFLSRSFIFWVDLSITLPACHELCPSSTFQLNIYNWTITYGQWICLTVDLSYIFNEDHINDISLWINLFSSCFSSLPNVRESNIHATLFGNSSLCSVVVD